MEELRFLSEGVIVAGRWKIVEKLGEGGMGAVFKVQDKKRHNWFAAMKVESDIADGGVLKLEVHFLQQLSKLKNTVKLLDSGQRDKYCFMVMTILGPDLMNQKRQAGVPFCEATTLRIAMGTLLAIKQVHETGYVHRDIKPGNCMMGLYGRDARCFYLIDYGMVRSFIVKEDGVTKLRKPRGGEQLFRGTPRYCSMGTHLRKEQGRCDDLWSWLYMLVELHCGLPWRRVVDEKLIKTAKENTPVEQVLKTCPKEFFNIHKYLQTLEYKHRPDYFGLWSECFAGLKRVKGSFLDRFEWERGEGEEIKTALSLSDRTLKNDFQPTKQTQMGKKLYPYANMAEFKEKILKF